VFQQESLVLEHIEVCLINQDGKNGNCTTSPTEIERIPELSPVELGFPDYAQLECMSHVIEGLWLLRDFISTEEEAELIKNIDADSLNPWAISSFNGFTDTKQYGVRTQFGLPNEERLVRQYDESRNEHGLPAFFGGIRARFRGLAQRFPELAETMKGFTVNECNVNRYDTKLGHYLTPHYDDRALSGPILLNLSLGCEAIMTYTSSQTADTPITLPRRCLQIVSRDARYRFKHSIKKTDVLGSIRVSLTFRMSGSKSQGVLGVTQNHITSYFR
jgi:hypothetical protein